MWKEATSHVFPRAIFGPQFTVYTYQVYMRLLQRCLNIGVGLFQIQECIASSDNDKSSAPTVELITNL